MKVAAWMGNSTPGLVLRPWRPAPTTRRLVACCSVRVSDVPRLLENAKTWRPFVDRVVVVLGSWSAPDADAELQSARNAIMAGIPGATVLLTPSTGWADQCQKRSAYFATLVPGEVALVLDADERLVSGGESLARFKTETTDVGWVQISNPARYSRDYKQPRLFALPPGGLSYRGRHHWVWNGDRLVATHQYGGDGWLHDVVPLVLLNQATGKRTDRWCQQHAMEAVNGTRAADKFQGTIEPLRILQLTQSDDGLVAYRLHSAINATTPHYSAFASGPHPFAGPQQFRWTQGRREIAMALLSADVVHCHSGYTVLDGLGATKLPTVIHHHGTRYRSAPEKWAVADRRAVLRLCSNLDLLERETGLRAPQWLPNPVPVGLYLRMAAAADRTPGPLRVAHSPSKTARKGTDSLFEAQRLLKARGVEVVVELLTGMAHAEVLRRKAACDVTFDSFWLGIQCSGLEGAAMGQAVIAGDPVVAGRYRARLGAVPYTYANDAAELAGVLERMVQEPAWRAAEAARVGEYVLRYHDETAVASRYIEMLHAATGCWNWKHRTAPPTRRAALVRAGRR